MLAYAAAIPFMNTTLIQGPIAKAWHGADIAYLVNLLAAAVLYGSYRLLQVRRSAAAVTRWSTKPRSTDELELTRLASG